MGKGKRQTFMPLKTSKTEKKSPLITMANRMINPRYGLKCFKEVGHTL